MYNAFFGLEKNPFASKPDPAFFYRSKQHDATLRSLMFAVQARMGLITLTGEEGTGKTAVLEYLHQSLESANVPCAFLRGSRLSTNRFVQTIAWNPDLGCQGNSAYQVFREINRFVNEEVRRGRAVALIVDDAHGLPPDVFNEVLDLASLHDDKVKLLQTVLAGRPELNPTLDALNLDRLNQRSILHCTLQPFTAEETKEYIEFRLTQAGMPKPAVFPPQAIAEIQDQSLGFAPAIHVLCESLLLAAFAVRSKVCDQEILDQVFGKPQGNQPTTAEVPGTVVAATGIDPARLAPPSAPEPAMMTALLRLAFDALPGSRLHLTSEPLSPLTLSLQLVLPTWDGELPVAVLASASKKASKKSVRLADSAQAAPRLGPDVVSPSSSTSLCPIHPRADFQPLGAGWEQVSLGSAVPARTVTPVAAAGSHNVLQAAIDFDRPLLRYPEISAGETRADFQPLGAGWERVSLGSAVPARTVTPVAAAGSHNVLQGAIDFGKPLPCYPEISAGETHKEGAPRISKTKRIPLKHNVPASSPLAGAPAGAHSLTISWAPAPSPMHPAATLEPAGTTRAPHVPVTPFRIPQHDPPSPAGHVHAQPVNFRTLTSPSIAREQATLREPNIREQNNPLPISGLVPPSPPSAAMPVTTFLNAPPSLPPLRPASNLEPVNPRASFLLLSTPPLAIQAKSPSFNRVWLAALAIPILAGLALYGAPPAIRTAADTLQQSWQGAHQAVLDRAAVALDEDFRAGLDDWMSRSGARPSWPSDAAGFVHPGALALFRPSLSLADYQMQFVGTIDKKGLSWVARAADFDNYYAIRLTVLKPGPVPAIGVTRYAVIHGKIQNSVTTPLVTMSPRPDTVYRVRLEVGGDRYDLYVQDQLADTWSEPRLQRGGVGFFSEQDAGSRIAGVEVKGQFDMLGRLCALLAPSAVTSYRASLNERAALTLTAAMTPPTYPGRLPRGSAPPLSPAFWQVPEVALPTRRCAPRVTGLGAVGTRRTSLYVRSESSGTCY